MLLTIDKNDARPLYLQIVIQIKEQIRQGTLKPGDELPSVRELAESLGINMHTVRSAYIKLRDQGIINLRLGRRATIARLKQPANIEAVEAEIVARIGRADYRCPAPGAIAGRNTQNIKPADGTN